MPAATDVGRTQLSQHLFLAYLYSLDSCAVWLLSLLLIPVKHLSEWDLTPAGVDCPSDVKWCRPAGWVYSDMASGVCMLRCRCATLAVILDVLEIVQRPKDFVLTPWLSEQKSIQNCSTYTRVYTVSGFSKLWLHRGCALGWNDTASVKSSQVK